MCVVVFYRFYCDYCGNYRGYSWNCSVSKFFLKLVLLLNYWIYWNFDKTVYRNYLGTTNCSIYCLSQLSNLEMSSDSTEEAEISHFAYLVLRIVPSFPTKIVVLCHHTETNNIFLPDGRVGPSPLTKMNKTGIQNSFDLRLMSIYFSK